mmetsp:Transcript_25445/g.59588  ORF Transcript_25445/g.59588 Transcript_25445/m.59588 type:complete len:94 (+) Transcript_25445:654-935(+)
MTTGDGAATRPNGNSSNRNKNNVSESGIERAIDDDDLARYGRTEVVPVRDPPFAGSDAMLFLLERGLCPRTTSTSSVAVRVGFSENARIPCCA